MGQPPHARGPGLGDWREVRMAVNCRDRQCERLGLKEPPSWQTCAGTSGRNVSGPFLAPTPEPAAP